VSSLGLGRDVVVLTCAISAGIHGALVPVHFEEGVGAGLAFAAAAGVLAALVVALTLRPESVLALIGAAGVFVGLLAGYALATTTGFPVLHPDAEPVDGLALATKAIEAIGLLAALHVLQPKGPLTWAHHGLRAPYRSR
jgi:hypothetical protein